MLSCGRSEIARSPAHAGQRLMFTPENVAYPPSLSSRSWLLRARARQAYLSRSLGQRLAMLMILAAGVSVLLATIGIVGLGKSNDSLRAVYEQRMKPVRSLYMIEDLVLMNRLLLQTAVGTVRLEPGPSRSVRLTMDRDTAAASADAIEKNVRTVNVLWSSFIRTPLTPKEAELAGTITGIRLRYLNEALTPALAALRAGNHAATQLAVDKAKTIFSDLEPQLEGLVALQFELASDAYQTGLRRFRHTRVLALSALATAILVMSWLGLMLIRSIVRPLQRIIETFECIAAGHYDSPIQIEGSDEISRVMQALQTMQIKLRDNEAAIHQLAFYDPLTNLPNRRLLHDRMEIALRVSARSGSYGAILMLDLDNFKVINDTKGHDVGDRLLVETAQRIKGCLRQADTVARLGGDEFVVMLVDLDADPGKAAIQAEGIGEKILQSIRRPCMLANLTHQNSASIGVALFLDHGTTTDDLLKRADLAMYQAKSQGRNTQRFFDPQIQAALESRLGLEAELRQALPDNQLELFYQVQVDNSRQVLGAEVLLRWRHAKLGLIQPTDFIPMAEESGLIVPIGEWVLRTTCQQLKRWEASPLTDRLLLSVNVSARQFSQRDFVPMVCEVLQQTGINPQRLKLELTESVVLHNVQDTVTKMKALNERGIQFSMDDFGTGYSSLSQLNKLPIAQLKIDRSFVSHIVDSHQDAVIVQTIIGMANNLGVAVIAEGVETEEQRALLEQLGCPVYQGYLAGKPMPLRDFEDLAIGFMEAIR